MIIKLMHALNAERPAQRRRPAIITRGFAIFALVVAFFTTDGNGVDEVVPALPASVNRFLQWLPEDTETLVVARSFLAAAPQKEAQPDWSLVQYLSLVNLSLVTGRSEKPPGSILCTGQRVKLAVMGGRHFETVSAFGSLRFEGCSVIEFDKPWLDDEVVRSLKKEAESIRRVHEHEVLVFPDQTVMEHYVKRKDWQGLFVAIPTPSIALCATSKAYLAEVLERMDDKRPRPRAMPPSLPEWKYIDPNAPTWAVRHVPAGDPNQQVAGLAWVLKPHGRNAFEVTYLPTLHGDADRLARRLWKHANQDVHPSIHLKDDGATVVSIDTEKESVASRYAFVICWSRGEDGTGGKK